jgi:hypothetical protein
MLAAAAEHFDAVKVLLDVAAGYKRAAVEAGFTEAAAEQMAVTYHAMMIDNLASSLQPS